MRVLFQQIRFHALSKPAHPAIMLSDRVITFGMIQSGIDSVRHVIADLRLEPDTCVGILIDNPARHLIIALALIASGHAFAPLRPDLLPAAKAAGVKILISDAALRATADMQVIIADEKWFMTPGGAQLALPVPKANRIIKVGFTSGSMGRPKAVAYSERAQMARLHNMFMVGMGKNERIMSAYGMSGPGFQQALQTLSSGRTVCFAPPADIVRIMLYYGADELRGSVGQVRSIVAEHDALDRPMRLKQVAAGGAYMPHDLAEDIRTSFGCELLSPYSAVETGSMGCASGALLRLRVERGNCYNITCDLEIVSDTGDALPPGEEGMIRIRSPQVARPYAGRPIEQDDAMDEWVYPGDVGRVDPDGLLVVTGRRDEVINFGGAKVDPEVIENIMHSHPAIEEVAALRMIGRDGVQQAWAIIKTRGAITVDSLNAWLAQRLTGELAAFQFARLEIVSEIPRTEAGKVARGALRKALAS